MARRSRRSGALDDLFVIAAKLPWKVSAGLAVVSFLIFHGLAGVELEAATSTKEMGTFAAKTIFQAVATVAQFIVPIVFVGGAIASFVAKSRRTELVESVAGSGGRDSLNEMTWREFEGLVEEAYRLRGYAVRRLGGDGPNGGVDLVLDRGAERVLVQCKQWRAMKVGVSTIRELYGVMAAKGAASGVVVTSGKFTRDAIEFASGRNIRLIAGEELHGLVREVRAAKPLPTGMTRKGATAGTSGCPRCGSPMVVRKAKRGASAGQEFYGCSRYPVCLGTLPRS